MSQRLYRAERFQDIVYLLSGHEFWPYKRWAVMALAAMGRKSEAIRYAESCRGPWTNDSDVDRTCEEILLSSGLIDEAYDVTASMPIARRRISLRSARCVASTPTKRHRRSCRS